MLYYFFKGGCMSYKSIQEIMAKSKELQKMQTHSLALQKISDLVIPLLPLELQQHVKVADYQNTTLFLELKNAAHALSLRFQLPPLLQKLCLKPGMYRLREIKYYVQPRQD
ncbi:MAG: Dna[CI] antecedent, DciA [Gammaproteobacteria bacterium]|nr:Dna[CI] antecedent, DciA [Gammaproteobacteria bacterium]